MNPLLDIYLTRREHVVTHPRGSVLWGDQPVNWDRCLECSVPFPDAVESPYHGKSHGLALHYSWAVPDDGALDLIARHAPQGVAEMGAGTGYWARLLAERVATVLAYDIHPPGRGGDWHGREEPFYPVRRGGPASAARRPDLALFLCWPPYGESMAADALTRYRGDTLIYLGEGSGGCTADDDFFTLLGSHAQSTDWRLVEHYQQPRWWGLRDSLSIYRRG